MKLISHSFAWAQCLWVSLVWCFSHLTCTQTWFYHACPLSNTFSFFSKIIPSANPRSILSRNMSHAASWLLSLLSLVLQPGSLIIHKLNFPPTHVVHTHTHTFLFNYFGIELCQKHPGNLHNDLAGSFWCYWLAHFMNYQSTCDQECYFSP